MFDVSALCFGQGTFVASDPYNNTIYQSGIVTNTQASTPANLTLNAFAGVTINGTPGAVYQIQYTTTLNTNWTTITNLALPYSPYLWVDTSTTVSVQRFYRSVQVQ